MLNMDFNQQLIIDTAAAEWQPSPMPGVWRKPLAREEAERGHATSIVRYEPGSRFSEHDHPLGEEILVLEGTFSDHTGDFKAGTYFRNPPGFRHAPFSDEGCLLLVKLHQFQPDDLTHLSVDTLADDNWTDIDGIRTLPLHSWGSETVSLLRLKSGQSIYAAALAGGAELFILRGALVQMGNELEAHTWARYPRGWRHELLAIEDTLVWLKLGHLPASGKKAA
jgi:hypothetical protein